MLLLSFLGVALPAVANAQAISSPFRYIEARHSVGIYGGYLLTDTGELDLGPQSAPMFGVRYDVRFSGPLSGEVQVGYTRTTRNVYVPSAAGLENPPTLVGDRDMTVVSALGGIRFRFTGSRTWRGFAPFAVVTGGVFDDLIAPGGIDAQLQADQRFSFGPGFAAGIGLGSDVYLTDRLAIRLEARDHLWRLRFPDAFFEEGAEDGEWTHNFGLTIGGSFDL